MVLAQSFREQLEFDSVNYLNFVLALEKRLEISIPTHECPHLTSLDRGQRSSGPSLYIARRRPARQCHE
jgi:hypothetical protein